MNSLHGFKKSCKPRLTAFSAAFLFVFSPFIFASLDIPQEWASVHENASGTNGRTIVLIQEAHVDYGAQKAIAEILKSLIEKNSLRLVMVEGGWGDVNLSYLRAYAGPKGRAEVAGRYLKEGKISGEEYLDLVSDLDFELWGIEDPALYAENMEAFLKINQNSDALATDFAKIESRLKTLKEKNFPAGLLELEAKKALLEEKKISLLAYIDVIKNLASAQSLRGSAPNEAEAISEIASSSPAGTPRNDWSGFPHLRKILSLSGQTEGAVDPAKAEWEKQNLIRALTKKLTKPELAQMELMKDRKSTFEELEFLKSLLEFRREHLDKVEKVSVAGLELYTKALEELVKMDPRKIFDELTLLEEKAAEGFLKTPEQKKLAGISRAFDSLKKLFELKLNPEEFGWIEKNPSVIARSLADFGGATKQSAAKIEAALPGALAFYRVARKREEALLKNIVKKIEAEQTSLSAVIMGGFHAEKIAEELKSQGFTVLVVSPRFTPGDPAAQQKHYLEILKYKWESHSAPMVNPN